jgi:hypothetical protein
MKTFIRTRNYMKKENRKKGAMAAERNAHERAAAAKRKQPSIGGRERNQAQISKVGMAVIFISAKNLF